MTGSEYSPMRPVEILLATYNSERYLAEQLDSILHQSDRNWRILIRDGGSTDGTAALLAEYIRREPDRIRQLPGGKASARENFGALLEASTAELLMFSDHDDVWLPDKIERSRNAFLTAEAELPEETPLLLFTDMRVVDAALHPISPSFFRHEHIDPEKRALNRLLLQNVPSGCTMFFNRHLLKLALPLPPAAVMHDHWLALCAAGFGKLAYLPAATLLYRQHGNNVYGASGYGAGYFGRKAGQGLSRIRERLYEKCGQAAAFLERYGHLMTDPERAMLADFSELPGKNWFIRRKTLWKYRIFKSGMLRNIGMFLIV